MKSLDILLPKKPMDAGRVHPSGEEFSKQELMELNPPSIIYPSNSVTSIHLTDTLLILTDGSGNIYTGIDSSSKVHFKVPSGLTMIWASLLYSKDCLIVAGGKNSENNFPLLLFELFNKTLNFKAELLGHRSEINTLAFTASDKTFVYSADDDGRIFKWRISGFSSEVPILVAEAKHQIVSIDLTMFGLEVAATVETFIQFYDTTDVNKDQVKRKLKGDSKLWSVKVLSSNKNYICVAGGAKDIYLWDDKSEVPNIYRGHYGRVSCLAVSVDEAMLVSGSYDNSVIMWDLNKPIDPFKFRGHNDWVRCLTFGKIKHKVYSSGEDCSVKAWDIPDLSEYIIINRPFSLENLDTLNIMNSRRILINNANEIFDANLNDGVQKSHNFGEKCYIIIFSESMEKCYAFFRDSPSEDFETTIKVFDLNYLDNVVDTSTGLDGILVAKLTADERKLICSNRQGIAIIEVHRFLQTVFIRFLEKIVDIILLTDTHILINFNNEKIIKLDLVKRKEDDFLYETLGAKMKTSSTNDELYLYNSNSKLLLVYMIKEGFLELGHQDIEEPVLEIHPHFQQKHLILRHKSSIVGYSLETLGFCFRIKLNHSALLFGLNSMTKRLYILTSSNKIAPYNINLDTTDVKNKHILGTTNHIGEFKRYLKNLKLGELMKRNPSMNDFLIMPEHSNIVTYFAVYNYPNWMLESLKEGAGFLNSTKGSPFDISIRENFFDLFESCIEFLRDEVKKNPIIFNVMEDPLFQTIKFPFKGIYRFFRICLCPSMVDFNDEKCESQFIDTLTPLRSDFNPPLQASVDQKFKFMQTYFRVPCESGSSASLQMLYSISQSEDTKLLSTVFMKKLLMYKWDQIYLISWGHFCIYFIYLVLVSVYSIDSYGEMNIFIGIFIVNMVIGCLEIVQILASGLKNYYKSIWNLLDTLRFCLVITYSGFLWGDYSFYINYLFGFLLFISFIEGLSYFRIFKFTRYYINLLLEVTQDISPFLIIFFYIIVGFGMIFLTLDHHSTDYYSNLTLSFELNIGNFDTSTYNKLQYLFFLLNTLLNPIIFLNMFINIMNETFSNVKGNEEFADYTELSEMILTAEQLMFWKRSRNEFKYFIVCDSVSETGESAEPIAKKLRGMSKISDTLLINQDKIKAQCEEMNQFVYKIHNKFCSNNENS